MHRSPCRCFVVSRLSSFVCRLSSVARRAFSRLKMQLALAVFDAVPLELCCTRLVLPEYFHEGARRKSKCRRRRFRVAILCRHDVKNVGDEQRKLRVARLDVPVAPRKFHLDFGRRLADIQRKSHLHAVQCVNFILFCAPAFGRLNF